MTQFYWYFAVPASVVLIVQTTLSLFGLSDGIDLDLDADGDPDVQSESGITLFSIRNMVAFFTFFGWGGIWLSQKALLPPTVFILAVFLGCVFMGLSMGTFYLIASMQRSGTLQLTNAIHAYGKVYIPIGAKRSKPGKVMVTVQGAERELLAMTDDAEPLATGATVKVIGLLENDTIIVTRDEQKEGETWEF